jgi:pilus assembly protein Flp/PilA
MEVLMMRFWREEEGQDLVEYGLLLAVIALAAIAAMSNLATAISTAFSTVSTNLTTAS